MRRAVFLDRDGTIIREAEYLADPDGAELLAGAAEGIRALKDAGFVILVLSNQSGVARGYFTETDVRAVNERVAELLAEAGAGVDGMYFCPHHPRGAVAAFTRDCACRKPARGMLDAAAADHGLDLAGSWVVGDKASDVLLGRRHGLGSILVRTGYGAATAARGFTPGEAPDFVVADLMEAAAAILGRGNPRGRA